jgi:hypothetical protein
MPSLVPNVSAYITFVNKNTSSSPNRKHKRDSQLVFLKLDPDGTVSITNSCTSAAIFTLTTYLRVSVGDLFAFVSPANVTAGSSDFTFGVDDPANIEGNFSAPTGVPTWNNDLFVGGEAIFGFPTSDSGLVIVSFNGSLPHGYFEPAFSLLLTNSLAALAGMYCTHIMNLVCC